MAHLHHPHTEARYDLTTQTDGTFAVGVTIPGYRPTRVSGFDTQEKAEAWIERHRANVATGSLKGAFGVLFKQH